MSRISHETVRCALKNELTPWRRVQRCYPPVSEAGCAVPMEEVMDRYSQPYAARYSVIGRDEPPKPLRADKRTPSPARPGCPATYDYAYVRRGPCTLWMFVEPLARGARPTPLRGARARTGRARCRPSRIICATARPSGLIRVCDPLNTHAYASLYRAFPPAEARRLARRGYSGRLRPAPALAQRGRTGIEWPRARPCPRAGPRVGGGPQRAHKGIHWQFRTADARVRLKKSYPVIET